MDYYQLDDENRRRENERERKLARNRINKAFRARRCLALVVIIVLLGFIFCVHVYCDIAGLKVLSVILLLAAMIFDFAVAGRCPHCGTYIRTGSTFPFHCLDCGIFPHRCPYCGESLEYSKKLEELYDHLKKADAVSKETEE